MKKRIILKYLGFALLLIVSIMVTLPPVPSEKVNQKFDVLNLISFFSVFLSYGCAKLFVKIVEGWKFSCLVIPTYLILIFLGFLLVRAIWWKLGILSEYGYLKHNLVTVSLFYALLYSFVFNYVFCLTINKSVGR